MKTLLKIIFNIIVYPILWFLQSGIILGIFVGIGLWDPSGSIGGTPGVVGLVCFYTSYVILKQIHKIKFIENFFRKN
tara:strand:- start:252 stop:482 length:231 start_codon:yes stop_codon:yes gene_type:complete